MKKEKKNQHYVPQFYLEHFSVKKNNVSQISVYDKKRKKFFPTNIRNVASSRFFYDFPSVNELKDLIEDRTELKQFLMANDDLIFNDQIIENFFSEEIENSFKKILDKIITGYTMTYKHNDLKNIISEEDKTLLSFYISLQMTRTNEFREKILELEEKALKGITLMQARFRFPDLKQSDFEILKKKELDSLSHASYMFGIAEKIAPLLFSHVWFIGINLSDLPFYTSDHPVVQFSHSKNNNFDSSGIASYGTEIVFPINEKLVINMIEREFWKDNKIQYENCYTFLNKDNVTFYNYLQATQSNSQIYSSNLDFATVKEILKKSPEDLYISEKVTVIAGGESIF